MLVAYGPDGHPVVAEEIPLEHLQRWSQERLLCCPSCRGVVHVRGGPEKRTQLHFAHQKGECPWSTESETARHMQGKVALAEWLRNQFPQASVSLEERLPEPNRIADIFFTHADGRRWAVEYQCAPLAIEEWELRHIAYHKANIHDIWVVGSNRREKQEAFIEAIIAAAREVMFLDALVTPSKVWLRWVVTRETVQEWQAEKGWTPTLEGWIGRSRSAYGATLGGQLHDMRLGVDGKLIHPDRSALEARIDLLCTMKNAQCIDAANLNAYLCPIVGEEVLNVVLFPMMRAYLRDPDLLRRYNYGRGYGDQPVGDADRRRVQQARAWLERLSLQGFPPSSLETLAKEIPLVGPYAAFASFVEMLAFLTSGETYRQG